MMASIVLTTTRSLQGEDHIERQSPKEISIASPLLAQTETKDLPNEDLKAEQPSTFITLSSRI